MISQLDDSKWFRRVLTGVTKTSATAEIQASTESPVIWFVHAGGGPAALIRSARTAPTKGVEGNVEPQPMPEVFACVLPGREDRFSEPLATSMDAVVAAADDAIAAAIDRSGSPPVLVGHSMGALIADSLARRRESRRAAVAGLIVMAMRSPDRFRPEPERCEGTDDEFAARIQRDFGELPPMIRDNAEARRLFLPIVRADLRLVDTYQPGSVPLTCPVQALGGTDDTLMDRASMQGWRNATTGSFDLRQLPGDHFFPIQHFHRVLQISQQFASAAKPIR